MGAPPRQVRACTSESQWQCACCRALESCWDLSPPNQNSPCMHPTPAPPQSFNEQRGITRSSVTSNNPEMAVQYAEEVIREAITYVRQRPTHQPAPTRSWSREHPTSASARPHGEMQQLGARPSNEKGFGGW